MHQLSNGTDADARYDTASRMDVVRRACNNDQHAFASLYEYYQGRLERYLFTQVRDREVSYDLYQDTFLRVWKVFSQQAPISEAIVEHFEAWLYRIATNAAIDYLRRSRKVEMLPLQ